MAITIQNSTEYAAVDVAPVDYQFAESYNGKIRLIPFTFTQTTELGDDGSSVNLAILPAGKYTIFAGMSKIYNSAFGTSRTLNVGHTGYTKLNESVVAADVDALCSLLAVATAGSIVPDDEVLATGGRFFVDTITPLTIRATCVGGTIPLNATLSGYFVVMFD